MCVPTGIWTVPVFILRKSSKHKTFSPLRCFLLGKASLPARFACLRSLSSMAGELAIATCFGLRTFTFQPNSHKPTICGEYQHDAKNGIVAFSQFGLGFLHPMFHFCLEPSSIDAVTCQKRDAVGFFSLRGLHLK